MTFHKPSLLFAALYASTSAVAWTWPSPALDKIESMRYDQLGPHSVILAKLGNPCGGNGGAPNAADWLRTSFHDMGTRDASSGQGGVDASIRFPEELNRPENKGDAFIDTVKFFRPFASRYVPLADLIALGAVFALEQCGNIPVPYRAGRVDATEPAPPGMPTPPQPLDTHTAIFARMGFSPQDMISMVACGHTIGGVAPQDFPDIIPSPADANADGVVPFDSSEDVYDNKVMREFVAGRSTDPLVVSPNVTVRSDLRIFNSDGGQILRNMANSQSFFQSTCSSIVERLINAVPANVQLSDVIQPVAVKPDGIKLVRNLDGSYTLRGRVRFWNLDTDPLRTAVRSVNLVWAGANGQRCLGCSVRLFSTSIGRSVAPSHSALWYEFPSLGVRISPSTSISKFWFEVQEIPFGPVSVANQGGAGYPLQTQVTLSADSCVSSSGGQIKINVPKGTSPSRVYVEYDQRAANGDVSKGTSDASLDASASSRSSSFNVYTAQVSDLSSGGSLNVASVIDGQTISDWSFFDANDANVLRRC